MRWPWAECGRESECSDEETDAERECPTKSKLIIAAICRIFCAVVGPAEGQGCAVWEKKIIVLYARCDVSSHHQDNTLVDAC